MKLLLSNLDDLSLTELRECQQDLISFKKQLQEMKLVYVEDGNLEHYYHLLELVDERLEYFENQQLTFLPASYSTQINRMLNA